MAVIKAGHNLFVIDIEYLVPLAEVQPYLEPHLAFVHRQYEAGVFLMSGPKEPRSGGVVIAMAASRAEIEAIMAQDPFTAAQVMRCAITEFKANNLADVLK